MEALHSTRLDSSIIAAQLKSFEFAVADEWRCVTIGLERRGLPAERASGAEAQGLYSKSCRWRLRQFPFTARIFNSASTASTLCTFTSAATLACSTSRIKSGSRTASSLKVSSISSGRISRRIAFCMSGRLASRCCAQGSPTTQTAGRRGSQTDARKGRFEKYGLSALRHDYHKPGGRYQ